MFFPLSNLAFIALAAVAGYLGLKWALQALQKDDEIEKRRRAAFHLAATLKSYGLEKTPKFLESYSVGDYSGMAHDIKSLAELFLSGEEHVVSEFKEVFDKCLAAKLKTDEGRAYIAAKLADAAKETDPSTVTDAPKAKAA
jgi:hypothetical protein